MNLVTHGGWFVLPRSIVPGAEGFASYIQWLLPVLLVPVDNLDTVLTNVPNISDIVSPYVVLCVTRSVVGFLGFFGICAHGSPILLFGWHINLLAVCKLAKLRFPWTSEVSCVSRITHCRVHARIDVRHVKSRGQLICPAASRCQEISFFWVSGHHFFCDSVL